MLNEQGGEAALGNPCDASLPSFSVSLAAESVVGRVPHLRHKSKFGVRAFLSPSGQCFRPRRAESPSTKEQIFPYGANFPGALCLSSWSVASSTALPAPLDKWEALGSEWASG